MTKASAMRLCRLNKTSRRTERLSCQRPGTYGFSRHSCALVRWRFYLEARHVHHTQRLSTSANPSASRVICGCACLMTLIGLGISTASALPPANTGFARNGRSHTLVADHRDGRATVEMIGPDIADHDIAAIEEINARSAAVGIGLRLTSVGDAGLTQLAQYENIEFVRVKGTVATARGIAALAGLPRLKILSIADNSALSAAEKRDLSADEIGRLRGARLGQTTVEAVGRLTSLRHLELDGLEITDADLRYLSGLVDLEGLALRHMAITDAAIQHLAGMTKLKALFLDHTNINGQGLKQLHTLTSLQHLDVAGTRLSDSTIHWLKELPRVRTVHVNGCAISEGALAEIRRDMPFTDFRADHYDTDTLDPGVKDSAGLRVYRRSVERMLDAFPYPGTLREGHHGKTNWVAAVNLAAQARAGDWVMGYIAQFTGVEQVAIPQTAITNEGLRQIAGLQELRSLDVSATAVSDDGIAHLAGLRRLQTLVLSATGVTDRGLEQLSTLKELQRLALVGTMVSDAGLPALARLPELMELDLDGCDITDSGIEALSNLQSLRKLWIRKTGISEEGVSALREKLSGAEIIR